MELIKFHTATSEPCETFCLQCSLMLSLIYGGPHILGPGMKAYSSISSKPGLGNRVWKPQLMLRWESVSSLKRSTPTSFSCSRGNQLAEAGPTTWVSLSLAQHFHHSCLPIDQHMKMAFLIQGVSHFKMKMATYLQCTGSFTSYYKNEKMKTFVWKWLASVCYKIIYYVEYSCSIKSKYLNNLPRVTRLRQVLAFHL